VCLCVVVSVGLASQAKHELGEIAHSAIAFRTGASGFQRNSNRAHRLYLDLERLARNAGNRTMEAIACNALGEMCLVCHVFSFVSDCSLDFGGS